MNTALIILLVLVLVLVLVAIALCGIYVINAQTFRIKAALTKWASLEIEVKNPSARSPGRQDAR